MSDLFDLSPFGTAASSVRKDTSLVRNRWRSPLNIRTPIVENDEQRKRWFGAPPSKVNVMKRHESIF